jgi:hypothetical protein
MKLLEKNIFHLAINIVVSNDNFCFILQGIEITMYFDASCHHAIMHYVVLSS